LHCPLDNGVKWPMFRAIRGSIDFVFPNCRFVQAAAMQIRSMNA